MTVGERREGQEEKKREKKYQWTKETTLFE
jgi:hypothetical protein